MLNWTAYREEEIADIHGDVNRDPDVSEMEPVAKPNQGQRDNMVKHELQVILPLRFLLQQHDNSLLRPVACL
jgi:hypothetical protein